MGNRYLVLTDEDIAALMHSLSEEELEAADAGVASLLTKARTLHGRVGCCTNCDCSGYVQGNPSTECGNCGHSWHDHRC